MIVDIEDTIAAIATASGPGLRGIIRLTGPETVAYVSQLFNTPVAKRPEQISVSLELQPGLALPGELLVWPSERSYTRQPSAEFHTHGSPPLLDFALERVLDAGCRLARPGEFTLRAFLGGRLDLTQAEAVLAVIDATEQSQFDVALQQLAGGLASPLSGVREQLINLLAEVEAGLDFVEEDIEFVSNDQIRQATDNAIASVTEIQSQIESRSASESTYNVVLVGWPNVGKSSLFNALLAEERAIVADRAGTTRDYVTATINRNDLQIQLIDTAGLESTLGHDPEASHSFLDQLAAVDPDASIEAAAQQASLHQLQNADLRICCLDSSRPLNEWEQRLVESLRGLGSTVFVRTKSDLLCRMPIEGPYLATSVRPDKVEGIEPLWDLISERLSDAQSSRQSVVSTTLSRCREHVAHVLTGLTAARDAAISQVGDEIVAAELRYALDQLGQIVGTVYTDDILDRIFGRFCIGK